MYIREAATGLWNLPLGVNLIGFYMDTYDNEEKLAQFSVKPGFSDKIMLCP